MKKIFLIIFSLLLFVSCEKVIEFDTSMSQSEPVLNIVASAGKPLSVYFSNTHFFLDTSNNHPVSGAEVEVTINGQTYRPTSMHRCNYLFDYVMQPDDSLSIRITTPQRTITANSYVPRMPQISQPMAFIDSSTAFNVLVANFNITDHPNYRNLYCITINERDSGAYYHPFLEYLDTIDTVYTDYFFCLDQSLTGALDASQSMGMPLFNQLLTTDDLIDGTTHNTSLMMMLLRDTNEIQPFIHQYTLTVECITPEFFRYLKDVGTNSGMMSLITEPPAMYSNVNGALGIVGGTARQTFPLATIMDGKMLPAQTPKRNFKRK